MMLIFGTFGALIVPGVFFIELGFFFVGAVLDAVRLAVGFFVDDGFECFAGALFTALVTLGAVATGVGAATAAGVAGGVAKGADGVVAGAPVGATFPVDMDVVVLLACCVPFVAPNKPAMNGFAMQS